MSNEAILPPPLAAARRLQDFVGQKDALAKIDEALFPTDNRLHVLTIQGEGGLGKSHLLEQLLRRDGVAQDDTLVLDPIDVIDARLHDRNRFIERVYAALRKRGHTFSRYETAVDRVRYLRAGGALRNVMDKAQKVAVAAFIRDLLNLTKKRRVAILIDTAERVTFEGSAQLINKCGLDRKHLRSRTGFWLQDLIESGKLSNVTLIIAGREEEGRELFDGLKDAARGRAVFDVATIKPFDTEETRQFLERLGQEYAQNANWRAQQVAGHFERLLDETDQQYRVVRLYTCGQPVLLALYAQVLAENRTIPLPLRRTFRQVMLEFGLDPNEDEDPCTKLSDEGKEKLARIRWEIEEAFVDLLFQHNDALHNRILLALIRAPRGLTAEQIHFVLDSQSDDPADWRPERAREGEIYRALTAIQRLYLGRARSSWEDLKLALDDDGSGARIVRVGLQDEIYRIFTEHMSLIKDLRTRPSSGVSSLPNEDLERHETIYQDEERARQALYRRLHAWADHKYKISLEEKARRLEQDERRLEQSLRLEDNRTYFFPALNSEEVVERASLNAALAVFEVERMVYELLLRPEQCMNTAHFALEDDYDKAGRQEEDFWAQVERDRVLFDDDLMRFVTLPPRKEEETLSALRRLAEQESVVRWIKRFTLRGHYKEAITYARQANTYCENKEFDSQALSVAWRSWNHTFSRCERHIWQRAAQIRLCENIDEAIAAIQQCIADLDRLYRADVQTYVPSVLKLKEGLEVELKERGFRGQNGAPDHPGMPRLRRLLSYAYATLGYAYRLQGHIDEAILQFSQALDLIRPEHHSAQPYRASLLNNLARVLSESGRQSTSVCLDGLHLRQQLAEEAPLAGSYNTLALIYDDMGRYEDAPPISVKAVAHARRADDTRQLALALRQVGESLRHLAHRVDSGQRALASSDRLYSMAETLLQEGRQICRQREEPDLLIDITIELGSLYRDRMRPSTEDRVSSLHEEYQRQAQELLLTAEQWAKEYGLYHYVIDAQLNLARVYYYSGFGGPKGDEAHCRRQARIKCRRQLRVVLNHPAVRDHRISRGQAISDEGDSWVYLQLSTVEMLLGWLANDEYREREAHFRQQYPHEPATRHAALAADPRAQAALRGLVRAYGLGLSYAFMFSPRSRTIAALYDDLYLYRFRRPNDSELARFHEHLLTLLDRYRDLSGFRALDLFLHDFYGVPRRHGEARRTERPLLLPA